MPPSIFAKPLLVTAAIAALAGVFLSIYYISAKYFFNESGQRLSTLYQQPLESGLNELKLSTSLSLPRADQDNRPLPESPLIPAWLPILLFASTLTGGWWLRKWYSNENSRSYDEVRSHSGELSSRPNGASGTKENTQIPFDAEASPMVESSQLKNKIARRDQEIVELNEHITALRSEFDLLENQMSDGATDLTQDELTQLKNENQSKSEIIQTLEELVSENRDKWLVSDTTESVMRQEIAELTENLNAAMTIIRANEDAPERSDTSERNLKSPNKETASN